MSLTPKQVEIIKSTVPILEQGGTALTKHFYTRMLQEDDTVRPFFNKTHQENDAQARALARSLLMYAQNIDNLSVLDELVERIVQKHCAILVQPEHYPIIGKYILMAMEEVLGKDTATPEVIEAWGAAYNQLADVLIEAENIVYDANADAYGGWRGYRQFRVAYKSPETSSVTSFYLRPVDDEPIIIPEAGQFLGFRFPMESGDVYNRQYSLSSVVDEDDGKPMYRISVKRLPGGVVSKHWHDKVRVGDRVDVSPPCGDMVLEEEHKDDKLVLIGAGIGITPLVAIAEKAVKLGRDVTFVQCERDLKQQPFANFFEKMQKDNTNFHFYGYFSCTVPEEADVPDDGNFHKHLDMPAGGKHGRLNKEELKSIMDGVGGPADIYIVGPQQFMRQHRKSLDEMCTKDQRVHYEHFGPTVE